MSSALEERWTPDQILGIARELLFECWTHSQESVMDNLYNGRLGAYWLLYELSRVVDVPVPTQDPVAPPAAVVPTDSRGLVSVYRHKRPLQQARDGVYQLVTSLPTVWSEQEAQFHYQPQTSLALLQSDWMGAHCLLCACEHRLHNPAACKKILATIHQRLHTVSAKQRRGDPSVIKGTAGIVQAILWLRQELEAPTLFHTILVDLAVQLITDGMQPHEQILFWPVKSTHKSPKAHVKNREHDTSSLSLDLGASRGTVGILFTLLGCSPSDWTVIDEKIQWSDGQGQGLTWIQNTIHHFVSQVEESMANQGDHDFLNKFDWAHGTCGYILLLLHAAQVLQQQSYLQQASDLCEWMWDRPNQWSRRLGLAFGSSTMAICFLQLSKVCPKPTNLLWQRRAEFVLQEMIREYKQHLLYYGLYDGLGGLVSAILQLHHKVVIEMPLYCHGHSSTHPPLLWQPNTNDDDEDAIPTSTTATIPSPLQKLSPLQPLQSRSISVETSPSSPCEARPPTSSAYTPLIVSARNTTRSHFSADNSNEQAFFWSLQTESHIGSAEAYKPALIEKKTIENGKGSLDPTTCQVLSPMEKDTMEVHSPKVEQSVPASMGTAPPPQPHNETIPSQRTHLPVDEHCDKHHQNSVTVGENKEPPGSLSSPPVDPRPSPATTTLTLSQCKPRPIPLEIKTTPNHERPRRPSTNILGGKVRLTRAAQLRMERIKKAALADSQASSTKNTPAPSGAIPTSNRHIRTTSSSASSRDSSNEPPFSSTNTSPEERSRQRRDDVRRRELHLEKVRGMAKTTTQSSKFHDEEKARLQKAKEIREQTEQQNRVKVQQQARERAQRVAMRKAQHTLAQEVARKKKEGEIARLERAKEIRHQLEAANRAKVEMQTQWKLERMARKEEQDRAKREAIRVEKLELAKKAMLQRQDDRRRIDESHARLLIKKLEKVEAVQHATTSRDGHAKPLRNQTGKLKSGSTSTTILDLPMSISSSVPSGPNTSPCLLSREIQLGSKIKDDFDTGSSEDNLPMPDLPVSLPSQSPAAEPNVNTEDYAFETATTTLLEVSPTTHIPADPSPTRTAGDDSKSTSLHNMAPQTLDCKSSVESTDDAAAHPGNTGESQIGPMPPVQSQILASDPPCDAESLSVTETLLSPSYALSNVIHPDETIESLCEPPIQHGPIVEVDVAENNQKSLSESCTDEATTTTNVILATIGNVVSSTEVTQAEPDPSHKQSEYGAGFTQETSATQSPTQLEPESSLGANKSSSASVDSVGFESIDAIFANAENALESELALILDPLPASESFMADNPNDTIAFENNTTSTSANWDLRSDEAISGLCEMDSAIDRASQVRLGPSNYATPSNGTQQNRPIESLNEFVGGCLESNGHALARSEGMGNDPKLCIRVEEDILPLGDNGGHAHQVDLQINPISEDSPCQQGAEGLNTFPPESSTDAQKFSASANCERDSAENKLDERGELLLIEEPEGSVPGNEFCSESIAFKAMDELEFDRCSSEEVALVEVGRHPEMGDPSPEHFAEPNPLLQDLIGSVEVNKSIAGDDDNRFLQSVSPIEALPNRKLDFGVEPSESRNTLVHVPKPDDLFVENDVDAHLSIREDILDGETRGQESSSGNVYMPNDGDNDGENCITTSWSSDTPDGFDELNQLFKEAENQLETELAATLGISGGSDHESKIKHESLTTPKKPATPVSASSLKVSMLSRRKVAAATCDAQYSPTTQVPGFKWMERLQNSKNKAD